MKRERDRGREKAKRTEIKHGTNQIESKQNKEREQNEHLFLKERKIIQFFERFGSINASNLIQLRNLTRHTTQTKLVHIIFSLSLSRSKSRQKTYVKREERKS